MPDVWYPGAEAFNGAHAGYSAGRIRNLTTNLAHFTVGRNSIGTCGRDFQILADRDGTLHQGAPVDAVCWGAGDPWNGNSLHIEVEYLPGVDDAIFTPAALVAVSGLLHWMWTEWGVPLDYYDGPRIAQWSGTISHRSLIQTGDLHNDWWPQEDWDAMTGALMAEVDLTLKALNDVRNVVGGDANLDGSAVVLSQIVADLRRIEAKVDALTPGVAPAPAPTHGTWTATP